jgi:hypothetical protein
MLFRSRNDPTNRSQLQVGQGNDMKNSRKNPSESMEVAVNVIPLRQTALLYCSGARRTRTPAGRRYRTNSSNNYRTRGWSKNSSLPPDERNTHENSKQSSISFFCGPDIPSNWWRRRKGGKEEEYLSGAGRRGAGNPAQAAVGLSKAGGIKRSSSAQPPLTPRPRGGRSPTAEQRRSH